MRKFNQGDTIRYHGSNSTFAGRKGTVICRVPDTNRVVVSFTRTNKDDEIIEDEAITTTDEHLSSCIDKKKD
jgi:hypothetical protein